MLGLLSVDFYLTVINRLDIAEYWLVLNQNVVQTQSLISTYIAVKYMLDSYLQMS